MEASGLTFQNLLPLDVYDLYQAVDEVMAVDPITAVAVAMGAASVSMSGFADGLAAFLSGDIRIIRSSLNLLLLDIREIALYVTLASSIFAILTGLFWGDHSQTAEVDRDLKKVEESALLRSMPSASAAEWDQGGPLCDADLGCVLYYNEESQDKAWQTGRSAWLELAVCVILDLAGIASYFFPLSGELGDAAFALLYGFTINLFFDWPALAVFGFWEELLPLTDVVPTATLAWTLVALGARRRFFNTPRKRSHPLVERQVYGRPDPHLEPNNQAWDMD